MVSQSFVVLCLVFCLVGEARSASLSTVLNFDVNGQKEFSSIQESFLGIHSGTLFFENARSWPFSGQAIRDPMSPAWEANMSDWHVDLPRPQAILTTKGEGEGHSSTQQNVDPVDSKVLVRPTEAFRSAYGDFLRGHYDLAISGFHAFTENFPSSALTPQAYYYLGESYYQTQEHDSAIETFTTVIEEFSGSRFVPPALFKLGSMMAERGHLASAQEYWSRVIKEYPYSPEAKLAIQRLTKSP